MIPTPDEPGQTDPMASQPANYAYGVELPEATITEVLRDLRGA